MDRVCVAIGRARAAPLELVGRIVSVLPEKMIDRSQLPKNTARQPG